MLLTPGVRLPILFVIAIIGWPLHLVFDIKLADLLKNQTTPVGVIGCFNGGAMNLAGSIQYLVQVGWTIPITFEWLLPLTGFRATESGVDHHVFGIFIVASTLVFVASWITVAISSFGGARVAVAIASTS